MTHTAFCPQGHPGRPYGQSCGPCEDEQLSRCATDEGGSLSPKAQAMPLVDHRAGGGEGATPRPSSATRILADLTAAALDVANREASV